MDGVGEISIGIVGLCGDEVMGQTSLTIIEIDGQETKVQIRGDVEHLSNIL